MLVVPEQQAPAHHASLWTQDLSRKVDQLQVGVVALADNHEDFAPGDRLAAERVLELCACKVQHGSVSLSRSQLSAIVFSSLRA